MQKPSSSEDESFSSEEDGHQRKIRPHLKMILHCLNTKSPRQADNEDEDVAALADDVSDRPFGTERSAE